MRIIDCSSDVSSSDLALRAARGLLLCFFKQIGARNLKKIVTPLFGGTLFRIALPRVHKAENLVFGNGATPIKPRAITHFRAERSEESWIGKNGDSPWRTRLSSSH